MLRVAQWTVFAVAAFIAISALYYFARAYFGGGGISGGTIGTIIAQLITMLWLLFEPTINKFHLLWLFPLSYRVGMLFGIFFVPLRLPKTSRDHQARQINICRGEPRSI